MMHLAWETTDAGRAALAAVHRTDVLPAGKRLDIEVTSAGTEYLVEHQAERVSPVLRAILANPAPGRAS